MIKWSDDGREASCKCDYCEEWLESGHGENADDDAVQNSVENGAIVAEYPNLKIGRRQMVFTDQRHFCSSGCKVNHDVEFFGDCDEAPNVPLYPEWYKPYIEKQTNG